MKKTIKQNKIPSRRKTVGEVALDLQQKAPETRDPIEIQRSTEQEYIHNLGLCVTNNRKSFKGNFYVVVITKNEKLLHNVFRCYFIARESCPTPDYDQTVFLFRADKEEIEHIWTVPNKEACLIYLENKDQVDPSEYPLLENIIKFKEGILYGLCKKLNNEEDSSNLLIV